MAKYKLSPAVEYKRNLSGLLTKIERQKMKIQNLYHEIHEISLKNQELIDRIKKMENPK